MKTKVNLDNLKVGDTIKLADGTVAVVSEIERIPKGDREFRVCGHCYTVIFLTEDGSQDSWDYRIDGTGNALDDEQIVAIIPKIEDDKLSYEEVIEELVIEADALEKDLEEAYVMIDALEIEAVNWRLTAKALHKSYQEQVEINKAKQDELDYQSEQLEEFMLGDFDDEVTIEFVSLDDLVDTEDELYDPFKADRFS
jgi:hypothetical protein